MSRIAATPMVADATASHRTSPAQPDTGDPAAGPEAGRGLFRRNTRSGEREVRPSARGHRPRGCGPESRDIHLATGCHIRWRVGKDTSMPANSAEITILTPPGPAQPLTLTIGRSALVDALATTGLISTRVGQLGWGGVLLEGHRDHLVVTTSDGQNTIRVDVPDVDTMHGRILIDHVELTKLLRALVKGRRKKDVDGMRATIDGSDPDKPVLELDGYAVPLAAVPMDGFPPLPPDHTVVAQLDRELFTAEAARVLRAIGTDDTLPMLSGILLDVAAGALTLAGTDRYRLAAASVPAITAPADTTRGGAVMPGALLAKYLKRMTGDRLRVGWLSDLNPEPELRLPPSVSLSSGNTTLISTSTSAEFPDYRKLFPTDPRGSAVVDRPWMLAETQRAAAVLAAKKHPAGQIAVTLDPFEVRVTPVLGERGEQVSAPGRDAAVAGIPAPLEYLFNPAYLVDALESFTGNLITLHPTGSTNRPVVFTDTPSELEDPGAFRHLLMPVRSQGT